ncbi:hypothetical protein TWF694_003277 [Orbilia ellipsospora]|uniref:Uncharacterized protein n=1 Tax=Orbilia ellipsospora TaxID=2528407 RepID=A0AAV9X2E1_9PEZI
MSPTISDTLYLEQRAAELGRLIHAISTGQLYRDVDMVRLSSSLSSSISPQNEHLNSLVQELVTIFIHFRRHGVSSDHPIKFESSDMTFTFLPDPYTDSSLLLPSLVRPLVMTVRRSPSPEVPQTHITLALVPSSLALVSQITHLHDDVDFDIQLTFSQLSYLEEAPGPIFEISAVIVCRRDIESWIRSLGVRQSNEDTDITLEIVRGPTRVFDEAGECWVVSLILI